MMHSPTPEENVDTVEGGHSRPQQLWDTRVLHSSGSSQPQAYVTEGSRGAAQPVMEEGEESEEEEEGGYWHEDPSIIFRPLRVDDLHEIKAVHEELFPVRYNMSFYEGVVRGYMAETRAPLLTLVAVDLSCPSPEFDDDETDSNIYEVLPPSDPDSSVSETIPPVPEMGAPASETEAPVSEAERRLPVPSPEPTPPSAADPPTSPYPPQGRVRWAAPRTDTFSPHSQAEEHSRTPSPTSPQEEEGEWRQEPSDPGDTKKVSQAGLTSVPRRILPVDSPPNPLPQVQGAGEGSPHRSGSGFPQRQRTCRRLRLPRGPDTGLEPSNIQVTTSTARRKKRRGRIVGVIIAQVTSADRCGDRDLRLWPPNLYTEVLYILTLGTLPGYRRRGLAQVLLHRCMAAATTPTLGAVYLHVITYNLAAIRFYESNQFKCLRTLPEYYVIHGARYDSYLYIRYINGAINADRATWLSIVFRPILRLAHTIMSTLLPFPSPPRLINQRRKKRPSTAKASQRRETENDLERLV